MDLSQIAMIHLTAETQITFDQLERDNAGLHSRFKGCLRLARRLGDFRRAIVSTGWRPLRAIRLWAARPYVSG